MILSRAHHEVLMQDPCPLGLVELLEISHNEDLEIDSINQPKKNLHPQKEPIPNQARVPSKEAPIVLTGPSRESFLSLGFFSVHLKAAAQNCVCVRGAFSKPSPPQLNPNHPKQA